MDKAPAIRNATNPVAMAITSVPLCFMGQAYHVRRKTWSLSHEREKAAKQQEIADLQRMLHSPDMTPEDQVYLEQRIGTVREEMD
jgi:hypothetical protein